MKIFIFDLDDTIIKHDHNKDIDYDKINPNSIINELLISCPCDKKYIFTNGTYDHAKIILTNMGIINNFDKIYSRDTLPLMKPESISFRYVENDIKKINNYSTDFEFVFFDDQTENLKMAHLFNWKTIFIHHKFNKFLNKPYIYYSYPNIYQAILSFNLKLIE